METRADGVESDRSGLLMQALGNHYGILQAERGATVSESAARSSLYLTSLSGAVIGLSFVAQASRFGDTFFIFALAILPVIFFLGTVTYYRVLQTGVDDVLSAQSMARIRGYFIEIDPSRADLFRDITMGRVGIRGGGLFSALWWQQFLSLAATIAIVNSVVGGVFIALAIAYTLGQGAGLGIAIGSVVALVIGVAYLRHQWATMMEVNRTLRHLGISA